MLSLSLCVLAAACLAAEDVKAPFGTDAYADSAGVKIHYVTMGEGPLIVLAHGFPDFWYTWRDQMPLLAKKFKVAAVDLRGYNLSDQPDGVRNYALDKLAADILAVVKHCGVERAIILGHDWGGAVAWAYAMAYPQHLERLILLNLPHPKCLQRELATNPAQRKNSQYARNFQKDGAHKLLTPEILAFWVKEPEAKKEYVAAFKRSSLAAMMAYYQANYPTEPYEDKREFPKVACPVLMIHGLKDPYLLPGALNGTWEQLAGELTLVTVPNAGHFVHRDATEAVNRHLARWLEIPSN